MKKKIKLLNEMTVSARNNIYTNPMYTNIANKTGANGNSITPVEAVAPVRKTTDSVNKDGYDNNAVMEPKKLKQHPIKSFNDHLKELNVIKNNKISLKEHMVDYSKGSAANNLLRARMGLTENKI